MPLFAVINTRGPAYRHATPMEEQEAWRPHADFMNALVDDGFVVLGGPLAEADVLLIVHAKHVGVGSRRRRVTHRSRCCGSPRRVTALRA